jgi:hypothetical protein
LATNSAASSGNQTGASAACRETLPQLLCSIGDSCCSYLQLLGQMGWLS